MCNQEPARFFNKIKWYSKTNKNNVRLEKSSMEKNSNIKDVYNFCVVTKSLLIQCTTGFYPWALSPLSQLVIEN